MKAFINNQWHHYHWSGEKLEKICKGEIHILDSMLTWRQLKKIINPNMIKGKLHKVWILNSVIGDCPKTYCKKTVDHKKMFNIPLKNCAIGRNWFLFKK